MIDLAAYVEKGPGTLPRAGLWMLIWMGICGAVFLLIFPLILRRRKRRAQQELHEKVEKAKADITEDGKIEGPKGPYVPHRRWNAGAGAGHEALTDHQTRSPEKGGYWGKA